MSYITNIHLENRILICEGKEDEIIKLSHKYNLPIVIGTEGNFIDGPYIERLYKKSSDVLEVDHFKNFISELVVFSDMYKGCKSFTFAEFTMKIMIQLGEKKIETPSRIEVVVFVDVNTDKYIIKTLNPENEKIMKLNPWQQSRVTRDLYQDNKLKAMASAMI